MIKYGLKIWSTNDDCFPEALKYCRNNLVDFIELYLVPGVSLNNARKILAGAPVQIHAPHDEHGFDIFKLNEEMAAQFKNLVIGAADFFGSRYIVVHAGLGRDTAIFKENIKKISDRRIIIENMPKQALNDALCFGYSLAQLEFIKKECGLDICLDFGHAIGSAASQGIDYKKFLDDLVSVLNPTYFHLCGGFSGAIKDEHLNLDEGNFDLFWIKNKLNEISRQRDIYLVFEVPKAGEDLANDLRNIEYFKNLEVR